MIMVKLLYPREDADADAYVDWVRIEVYDMIIDKGELRWERKTML